MPLTLRPKDVQLAAILDSLLAGNIITDISQISSVRQLAEGVAADLAQGDFSLYELYRSLMIATATGEDLHTLMRDKGLEPDIGQVASDPLTYTRVQTWLEDILLPAPQVVQATLTDGTVITYRSIGDAILQPQGRSISAQAPVVTLVGGSTDQLQVNLDDDGPQTVTLGTQTTGSGVATTIQTAVRAMLAAIPGNQPAYQGFRCDYDTTTPGALTLRSGSTGPASTVVITPGLIHDATELLKLGIGQGGIEAAGQDTIDLVVLCDQLGVIGNVGAGQIRTQASPVAGIQRIANTLMFANGREPASDDANRQDFRNYLRSLGRGMGDALERAVYATRGEDGLRHVLNAQVLSGAGAVHVYLCDGRSLTVAAQSDVVQDVQDELDGVGQTVGGWVPIGTRAGVAPATVRTIPMDVTIFVGPTVDHFLAQQAAQTLLYELLYRWPIGTALSESQVTREIDKTIAEMFGVLYVEPSDFLTNTRKRIEGRIGEKLMPGIITVDVEDA